MTGLTRSRVTLPWGPDLPVVSAWSLKYHFRLGRTYFFTLLRPYTEIELRSRMVYALTCCPVLSLLVTCFSDPPLPVAFSKKLFLNLLLKFISSSKYFVGKLTNQPDSLKTRASNKDVRTGKKILCEIIFNRRCSGDNRWSYMQCQACSEGGRQWC